jgi:hypothetical protein
MRKIQLKVTITKIFDAEFEGTRAAERMLKTLEEDRYIGVLTATSSSEGWQVRQRSVSHSVEPIREDV